MTRWHSTRRSLAARGSGEVARTFRDRWRPRTSAVPRTPADVTADVLASLVGLPSTAIRSVSVQHEDQGTATRARLAVSAPGTELPATVFVKTTPTRVVERIFHNVYGLGQTEAEFYRKVAPELSACTPVVYGTGWDAATGRSIIVMEDLAARGTRFADASVGCTADDAAAVTATLATVQRRFWESPRFGDELKAFSPFGNPSLWFGAYSSGLLGRLPKRYHDIVDADFLAETVSVLHARREDVDAVWRALPQSLLHGDTHRGNIGFELGVDGADAVLFDWQVAGQGPALKDLAYFLATSVEPDVRRAIEVDLVRAYVDAVRAGGGPDVDQTAAWDAYRMLVVTGYVSAAFTATLGARLQNEDVSRAALTRTVAAAREHDSFGRLRARFG